MTSANAGATSRLKLRAIRLKVDLRMVSLPKTRLGPELKRRSGGLTTPSRYIGRSLCSKNSATTNDGHSMTRQFVIRMGYCGSRAPVTDITFSLLLVQISRQDQLT